MSAVLSPAPAHVPPAATATGSVLIIDGDDHVRQFLRKLYGRCGWTVLEAAAGSEGLRMLYKWRPDIVVLDVESLADAGWDTLSRIRQMTGTPIIVLSAQATESNKVRALRAGADDYVTKPFGSQELIARTEAAVRRGRAEPQDVREEHYHDDLIGIDFARQLVLVDGSEVTLTPLEFRLLSAFVGHPNHVLSPGQLRELAWNSPIGTTDQVKVYVGYLRGKLGIAAHRIETARGFGYRFRPVERCASAP